MSKGIMELSIEGIHQKGISWYKLGDDLYSQNIPLCHQ